MNRGTGRASWGHSPIGGLLSAPSPPRATSPKRRTRCGGEGWGEGATSLAQAPSPRPSPPQSSLHGQPRRLWGRGSRLLGDHLWANAPHGRATSSRQCAGSYRAATPSGYRSRARLQNRGPAMTLPVRITSLTNLRSTPPCDLARIHTTGSCRDTKQIPAAVAVPGHAAARGLAGDRDGFILCD